MVYHYEDKILDWDIEANQDQAEIHPANNQFKVLCKFDYWELFVLFAFTLGMIAIVKWMGFAIIMLTGKSLFY